MVMYISENKYYILGIILLIIMGYTYMKVSSKENEKDDKIDKITADNRNMTKLIKSLETSIKNTSDNLIVFNKERTSKTNYLNVRNELFTKDIIKRKILIDSSRRNGEGRCTDYKISLKEKIDTYNNIIGIRLIECVIPIISKNININNNKILIYIAGGTDNNPDWENGYYKTINFETGVYDGRYETNYDWGSEPLLETRNIYQYIEKTFKMNGVKVEIRPKMTGNNTRTDMLEINRVTNFRFMFKTTGNSFYKLLGYDKIDEIKIEKEILDGEIINNIIVSEEQQPKHQANQTYDYLDIVLEELPQIGCKMNTDGKHILDRIFVNVSLGNLLIYRVPESETQTTNYFYPLGVDNLTIKIYTSDGEIYDESSGYNFIELELTKLENTKLMN